MGLDRAGRSAIDRGHAHAAHSSGARTWRTRHANTSARIGDVWQDYFSKDVVFSKAGTLQHGLHCDNTKLHEALQKLVPVINGTHWLMSKVASSPQLPACHNWLRICQLGHGPDHAHTHMRHACTCPCVRIMRVCVHTCA